MISSFSDQKIPTEKLFVLYYPPSMAHLNWSHSVYAAGRAAEAIEASLEELRHFKKRYVIGPNLYPHLAVGVLGLVLLAVSAWSFGFRREEAGIVSLFIVPFIGLILTLYGRVRYKAYAARRNAWRKSGSDLAVREIEEIEKELAGLPKDPTAEEAAPIMRRDCPEVFSEIAFQGANFRAFTYLDLVLYPRLKNPVEREELPDQHSLYRDAYYVGEVVYDSWRTFQRDRRDVIDPRFVGSGGRRGVI